MVVFFPIVVPGVSTVLHPISTLSPTMAPSFLHDVLYLILFIVISMFVLSIFSSQRCRH